MRAGAQKRDSRHFQDLERDMMHVLILTRNFDAPSADGFQVDTLTLSLRILALFAKRFWLHAGMDVTLG
jgi:hypothetical protein